MGAGVIQLTENTVKLMIRNTSRDKTTAALRKARPGDVQPYPTIKKVRLPPGGSLNLHSEDLNAAEVAMLATLSACGCLKVLTAPGYGPMRQLGGDEILGLAPVSAQPAPVVQEPVAAPEPVVEPEPVAESGRIVAESEAELDDAPQEKVEENSEPLFLEPELKAMKNADLRDVLSNMGFDSFSGMKKSDLVAKILELQEA